MEYAHAKPDWSPIAAYCRAVFKRAFQAVTWQRVMVFWILSALYAARLLAAMLQGIEGPIPWLSTVGVALIQSQLRFAPVFVLVSVAFGLPLKRPTTRAVALALAVLGGCASGLVLTTLWFPDEEVGLLQSLRASFGKEQLTATLTMLIGWCWLAGMATAWYFFAERGRAAANALFDEESVRIGLDRRLAEARLQVMQAQIEPHFLFNTLANVRRLYRLDHAAGKAMLQQLSHYLSSALPQMRHDGSTLEQELALTTAYLGIQGIRMGTRLTYEVDAPSGLRKAEVPPMMLATLAENAIKHGLGPLPEGGRVTISASGDGKRLRLQVSDTGRGFVSDNGSGVGLANIRARLAALYGDEARLLVSSNSPRGISATIELPQRMRIPADALSIEAAD